MNRPRRHDTDVLHVVLVRALDLGVRRDLLAARLQLNVEGVFRPRALVPTSRDTHVDFVTRNKLSVLRVARVPVDPARLLARTLNTPGAPEAVRILDLHLLDVPPIGAIVVDADRRGLLSGEGRAFKHKVRRLPNVRPMHVLRGSLFSCRRRHNDGEGVNGVTVHETASREAHIHLVLLHSCARPHSCAQHKRQQVRHCYPISPFLCFV